MKTLYSIMFLISCFLLNSCTFYEIKTNNKKDIKFSDTNEDGIPVAMYYFGCKKNHRVYRDDNNDYWLYCTNYEESTRTNLSFLVKTGPDSTLEKYLQDENDYKDKIVSDKIKNMKKLPELDNCKDANICYKSSTNKNSIKLKYINMSTYIEYMYSPVIFDLSKPNIVYSCGNSDVTKRLLDNRDGTLTDNTTGLIWRRCAFGKRWDSNTQTCTDSAIKLSWDQSIGTALKDNYGGFNDWRVPTKGEYETLIPDDCKKCGDVRSSFEKIFLGYQSSVAWGDAHWTADNSSNLQEPVHVNFQMTGMGCDTFDTALRPFVEKPVMMVRGGTPSITWKKAVESLPLAAKANEKSRKDSEAYWGAVDQKIKNFLTKVSQAASQPAPSNNSSGLPVPSVSQKTFICDFDCDTGESAVFKRRAAFGSVEAEINAKDRDEARSLIYGGGLGTKICKEGRA